MPIGVPNNYHYKLFEWLSSLLMVYYNIAQIHIIMLINVIMRCVATCRSLPELLVGRVMNMLALKLASALIVVTASLYHWNLLARPEGKAREGTCKDR